MRRSRAHRFRSSPAPPSLMPARQRVLRTGSRCCTGGRSRSRRGLGGFLLRLALFARHRFFRIVALRPFHHAGSVEKAHHPVRRLRALGHPRFDLVQIELQPFRFVLRQQRIEITQPLDEAAVARRAAIGDDDVIDRPLLGAGASHANDDRHVLLSFLAMGQCCSVTRTRPFAPTAVSPVSLRMRPRRSMISPSRRGWRFTDTTNHSRVIVSSA